MLTEKSTRYYFVSRVSGMGVKGRSCRSSRFDPETCCLLQLREEILYSLAVFLGGVRKGPVVVCFLPQF